MVLVKTVLYEGLNDTASISALFPGWFQTMQWCSLSLICVLCFQPKLFVFTSLADFHKNLKGLLSDLIAKNM